MKQNPTLRVSVLLTSLLSILLTTPLSYANKSPIITGPVVGVAPIIKAGIKLTGEGPYIQQELNGIEGRKILMPGSIIELPVKAGDLNYYSYYDKDTDSDSLRPEITWYIASAKNGAVIDWAPFGTEVTELTHQMIGNQDDLILEEIESQYVLDNGLKLKVPPEALGKRIAVAVTPRSLTGFPIKGKPLFLADLNYTYEQTFPDINNPTMESIQANAAKLNSNNGGDYVMDRPNYSFISWNVGNDIKHKVVIISGRYTYEPTEYNITQPLSPLFDDHSYWSWELPDDSEYGCGECEYWRGEVDLNDPTSSGVIKRITFPYDTEIPDPAITLQMRNRYGILGQLDIIKFTSTLTPPSTKRTLSNAINTREVTDRIVFSLDDLLLSATELSSRSLKLNSSVINYAIYAFSTTELEGENLIEQDYGLITPLCGGQYELKGASERSNELSCSVPESELDKIFVLKLDVSYLDIQQNSQINLTLFDSKQNR